MEHPITLMVVLEVEVLLTMVVEVVVVTLVEEEGHILLMQEMVVHTILGLKEKTIQNLILGKES